MTNLKLGVIFLFIFSLNNCQTINDKTDEIAKKENKKLSKFIGRPISDLKISLGEPDYIDINESNNKLYVYETQKYGILCKRKFEINDKDTIIGFISKGCF